MPDWCASASASCSVEDVSLALLVVSPPYARASGMVTLARAGSMFRIAGLRPQFVFAWLPV